MRALLPLLAATLATGPIFAQNELAQVRKQNAQLRAENQALREQLAKVLAKKPGAAPTKAEQLRAQQELAKIARMRKQRLANEKAARARQPMRPADVARIQKALRGARAKLQARKTYEHLWTDPAQKAAYENALKELHEAAAKLRTTSSLEQAAKQIDALQQVLLRARAALWKQRQAKKDGPN